jgi:hypothetical protein
MKLKIDQELLSLIAKIQQANLNEDQWAEIESSDMFQSENYSGGYDADDNEFCFSHFSLNRNEYWFSFTIEDVEAIINNEKKFVEARIPDA